jgi:preprotein translocase subunit SecG
MVGLLTFLIIIASILLIIVVFIQNPKGGGLSSDFGAATQIGGVQKTNDIIDKTTWGLAIAIVVISVVLTIKSTPEKVQVQQPTEKAPQQGGAQ